MTTDPVDARSRFSRSTMSLAGIELELLEGGDGAPLGGRKPLLFLHGAQGVLPARGFLAALASERRVIAPSHPGFGRSGLPDWLDRADDIARIYLELMDLLGLDAVEMIGCSVGGWIAADLASTAPERVRRLVLVGPVGVKVGPAERLDIPDIFAMPQEKLNRLLYHDPDKHRPDFAAMSDEEITIVVRNRETLALITWEPYMHDPKPRQHAGIVRARRQRRAGVGRIPHRLCGAPSRCAHRDDRRSRARAAGRAARTARRGRREIPQFVMLQPFPIELKSHLSSHSIGNGCRFLLGACSYRRTGTHFAGTRATVAGS
jgi:pimeloyl-ACP methyl ester carboxylesterase